MAFCSVLVSVPLAFLASLLWAVLIGGSFLKFLLVYAVSAQIAFVAMMFVFLLARVLCRRGAILNRTMPEGIDTPA